MDRYITVQCVVLTACLDAAWRISVTFVGNAENIFNDFSLSGGVLFSITRAGYKGEAEGESYSGTASSSNRQLLWRLEKISASVRRQRIADRKNAR